MTEQEQRIAIAEACGWHIESGPPGARHKGVAWRGPKGEGITGGGLYGWGFSDQPILRALPDYLHDLNAMHEAEKTLSCRRREYVAMLGFVTTGVPAPIQWPAVMATAAQRAEAFLRVKGL